MSHVNIQSAVGKFTTNNVLHCFLVHILYSLTVL